MRKESLPASTQELENSFSGFTIPRDPDTGTPYEYRQISNLSFELCAEFKTENFYNRQLYLGIRYATPKPIYPTQGFNGPHTWDHGKGHACFTRTIDPKLYKPQPQREKIPIQ